eukprot:324402_1
MSAHHLLRKSTHIIKLHNSQNSRVRLLHNNIDRPLKITEQINLHSVPLHFKTICILTGITITFSSLYMLQENLLFGTVAGITSKTCTAPLERLTTHRQASIDAKYSISSIVTEIYKEETLLGLWRGNGLNIFRASLKKGQVFALNDLFRTFANKNNFGSQNPAKTSFLCGSMAGLISTLITYPLDQVKTVNQSTIHSHNWPSMTVWYALTCKRGLTGVWTAVVPWTAGTTTYYGLTFMTYPAIIKQMNIFNDILDAKYNVSVPTDLCNAIGGFFSAIVATLITYPNNCICKRMQTSHICEALEIDSKYIATRFIGTIKILYIEGGIGRLYRGFAINLCRNAPNTAVQFVVYKRLQRMWNDYKIKEEEEDVFMYGNVKVES